MKAVKVQDHNTETVHCPHCHSELEKMRPTGFAIGSTNELSVTLPIQEVALVSANDHSQFFKRGEFGFCPQCQELVFVYTENDYRRCKDCQHCGTVKYRRNGRFAYGQMSDTEVVEAEGCMWYNVPFGGSDYSSNIDYSNWSDAKNHSHCKHIDETRVEPAPQMACFLCKHYRSKEEVEGTMYRGVRNKECDVYCPVSTFSDKVSRMVGVCTEFEADYEKYKQYRASFEDMLIPPDGIISIPEFDARIKAEENK